ncbi:MAG: hypothetical protein P4L79_09785 [Legionella sp.]|uniref:hypothetical protein n=1 Tax=Legionella sp. TaxID=459 RepID=UPI002840090B|nr:hypothetical protein [Legionella sp.]
MSGNISPIFSRVGDIQGSVLLQNPVNTTGTGYTGADANTVEIYSSDAVNGGFVQRIRIKAMQTQPANVVRFWLAQPYGHLTTTTTAPQTPTATISTSAGTMTPGLYYMKVQAIDALGQPGAFSTEISNTVPASGNNIVWGWSTPATGPAAQGISNYRLAIGMASGQEQFIIANTGPVLNYTQNTSFWTGLSGNQVGSFQLTGNTTASFTTSLTLNTTLIGEISIPAITLSASAATADFDYPINIAVPPGYRIIAGLGTVSANGLFCTAIAGKY